MEKPETKVFEYYHGGTFSEFLSVTECSNGDLIVKVRGEPATLEGYMETGDFAFMRLPRRIVQKLVEGLRQTKAMAPDDGTN